MKRFVEGADRSQVTLLPECLDDYIGDDNPVRVIDVFVDELDLADWASRAWRRRTPGVRVPPGGAAEDLHLRVSQPPAVESAPGARGAAQRRADVADRALDAGLQDHRRLPQGQRQGDPQRLRHSSLCRQLDLFSQAMVAIDGSKFKAVNNRDKNFTDHKLRAHGADRGKHRALSGRARAR